MARDEANRGKTIFAVSHGQFLHNLVLAFWPNDKALLESYMFIPMNNSLTIIDFDVQEYETKKGDKG